MKSTAKHHVLLGFDFGTKRIGVAVGQTITRTARPLTTLSAQQGVIQAEALQPLIKTWQPDGFVVGIPLNMDGTEQPITHAARRFAHWLTETFSLPVHEVDERLSTRDARERIFSEGGYRALQTAEVDSLAAQIILQNWLDTQEFE
ncbi:MAG: Holliday junction resolvase RuvX [Gammaproteobacteria bacterium]|nr:Holliday junction resolvase RuvX [Gammaproteobacteria bacterium]